MGASAQKPIPAVGQGTLGGVCTRHAVASVHADLAFSASKCSKAVARVAFHQVLTRAPVSAWSTGTLIDIFITARPTESWHACTLVTVNAIDASAAVLARSAMAVVDVIFAAHPCVSGQTLTHSRVRLA